MKYEIAVTGLGVFGDFRNKAEAVTAYKKYVSYCKANPKNVGGPSEVILTDDGKKVRHFTGAHEVGSHRETAPFKAFQRLIHKHALDAGLLSDNYEEAVIEALAIIEHICDERDVDFNEALSASRARYQEETE